MRHYKLAGVVATAAALLMGMGIVSTSANAASAVENSSGCTFKVNDASVSCGFTVAMQSDGFTFDFAGPTKVPATIVDGDWSDSFAIASYSWDFGDGTTSSEANPVHAFAHSSDGGYTSYRMKLTTKWTDTESFKGTVASISTMTETVSYTAVANDAAAQAAADAKAKLPVAGGVNPLFYGNLDGVHYGLDLEMSQMSAGNTVTARAYSKDGKLTAKTTWRSVKSGATLSFVFPVHKSGSDWWGTVTVSSPGHRDLVKHFSNSWVGSKPYNWYVRSWMGRTHSVGTAKAGSTIAVASPLTSAGRRAGASARYIWTLNTNASSKCGYSGKTTDDGFATVGTGRALRLSTAWRGCKVSVSTWVSKGGFYGTPSQTRSFGLVR